MTSSEGPERCERGWPDGDQWEPQGAELLCQQVCKWPQALPPPEGGRAPRQQPPRPPAQPHIHWACPGLLPTLQPGLRLGGAHPNPSEAPKNPSPGQDGPQVRASVG